MSIKKFGQGGEYLHLIQNKKFIPFVFFTSQENDFLLIFCLLFFVFSKRNTSPETICLA